MGVAGVPEQIEILFARAGLADLPAKRHAQNASADAVQVHVTDDGSLVHEWSLDDLLGPAKLSSRVVVHSLND